MDKFSNFIFAIVNNAIVPAFLAGVVYLLTKTPKKIKFVTNLKSKFVQKDSISRKIPTTTHLFPFPLYLIDGILTRAKFRRFGVKFLEELREKYGKIYWIPVGHLQVLVLNDVDLVQKFLSSSNPQHLNKPEELYDRIFIGWFRDGIVNSKYPIWSVHRKMLNRCFTYKSLQNYLPSINKHGKSLVKNLIKTCYINGSIENAEITYNQVYSHVLRIVSDVVMGTTSLPDNTINEFASNFRCFKHLATQKLLNPFLWFPPIWYFHPKRQTHEKAISYLDNYFKNIIKEYREEHQRVKTTGENLKDKNKDCEDENIMGVKPHRCLIEEMICVGATNKEIIDEVATFLAAGIDTTVVALQMFMLHMGLNPNHQAKCREEVDQVFREIISENNSSQENNDQLDLGVADLTKLKYLDRCIHESARLTPGSPIFLRRIDAPLKLADDLVVKAGSTILVPVWSIHRDSDNYPDPKKYDPDRFLPENSKYRHAFAYIPFSGGPRNCIGWKMALWEIKVIMAWILRHFEIECKDKLENVKLLFEVTLLPERYYNIILKRRCGPK